MISSSASDQLTAVLHAAQYLSNLTFQQDPWAEWAQALQRFFGCDLVLIVEPDQAGTPQLVHDATCPVPTADLLEQIQDEVRAVLASGFLGSQQLTSPPCALALIPLPRDRRTAAVAIIGQTGAAPFPKEELEIFLALGGLFANVVARTETERELREYQRNLEGLVARRTAELEASNAQLLHESHERQRAESERRAVEAHLQQAQKLESLGSLAGGVAHDMNNVLGAILSLASAQLAAQSADSPARPALATIRDAALRGGAMVKGLLHFARKSPVESRPLDLNALLAEVAQLLEHTTLARVRLVLDLAPELPPILGDPGAITQVFMNLCVNACDAMEPGGSLTLATRPGPGGQVEIIVADTGCGMSPGTLARAVDPFFTTKEVGKGTGLGLAIVYNAVKAHQGEMDIASEPGRGTQVTLSFPAALAQLALPVPPPPPSGLAWRALDVLLVDDDELIQTSTGMLVTILGHRVALASTGEAAIALLEGGLRPDVVILDMNMPGFGGKGPLPLLRAICPQVPVLLSPGRSDQDALDLMSAHPGVTLLPKPFTIEALKSRLESI